MMVATVECPSCDSEGPHPILNRDMEGVEVDLLLECAECGREFYVEVDEPHE